MREIAIEDRLSVDASPDTVWAAIEDPARHAAWHPFLTKIEGEHALGAERICSVQIGGKPARTSESCIVAEPAQRMIWRIDDDTTGFNRMVSDWSAGFTLAVRNGGTLVTAQSVFRPRNLFVLLMMPLLRRKFHQTQRAILEALKTFSEASREGADSARAEDIDVV